MNPKNILLLLEIIDRLLASASSYAQLARRASAEGRDISDDELTALEALDDASKAALEALIASKQAAPQP